MQQLSQKHVKTLSFLSSGSEQQNENKNVEQWKKVVQLKFKISNNSRLKF